MTGRRYAQRTLLVVFFYFIQYRRKCELSFIAADIYLLLLQIPGSMAYNIFHPLIFRSVLSLLKAWQSRNDNFFFLKKKFILI